MSRVLVCGADADADAEKVRRALGHVYDVHAVAPATLAEAPWHGTTAAVVLGAEPAGAAAAASVAAFVERGGTCVVRPGSGAVRLGGGGGGGGHVLVATDAAAALVEHLGVPPAPAEVELTPLYLDGDAAGDVAAAVRAAGAAGLPPLVVGAARDAPFSVAAYRRALDACRRAFVPPWTASVWGGADVRLGDTLGYAPVATSTQTLLEDARLQAALPSGAVLLATHQVAGRGRGRNRWISPAGCLQFSALWRQPLRMAPRMVFVQYLAALAMVVGLEHAFGPAVRGRLRIKWPNDVYAQVESGSASSAPSAGIVRTVDGVPRTFAKVGGALVNAATHGSDLAMVIGCGINCLNTLPTLSVAHAAGARSPPPMETCAASVHTALESILGAFASHGGSFAPLAHVYRALWLNADDEVLLAERGERVRIVGVTSDHGLLRTVPVTSTLTARDERAWGPSGAVDSIELQPDGNTYDMLHNMVRQR